MALDVSGGDDDQIDGIAACGGFAGMAAFSSSNSQQQQHTLWT
jgi:hypothetical protein